MEKFFDKEGLIDTLHTMLTKGKISMSDYRMWFHLNNKTKISILTPETDGATIMNGFILSETNASRNLAVYVSCHIQVKFIALVFPKAE